LKSRLPTRSMIFSFLFLRVVLGWYPVLTAWIGMVIHQCSSGRAIYPFTTGFWASVSLSINLPRQCLGAFAAFLEEVLASGVSDPRQVWASVSRLRLASVPSAKARKKRQRKIGTNSRTHAFKTRKLGPPRTVLTVLRVCANQNARPNARDDREPVTR
jgi:hypothetical protein